MVPAFTFGEAAPGRTVEVTANQPHSPFGEKTIEGRPSIAGWKAPAKPTPCGILAAGFGPKIGVRGTGPIPGDPAVARVPRACAELGSTGHAACPSRGRKTCRIDAPRRPKWAVFRPRIPAHGAVFGPKWAVWASISAPADRRGGVR